MSRALTQKLHNVKYEMKLQLRINLPQMIKNLKIEISRGKDITMRYQHLNMMTICNNYSISKVKKKPCRKYRDIQLILPVYTIYFAGRQAGKLVHVGRQEFSKVLITH